MISLQMSMSLIEGAVLSAKKGMKVYVWIIDTGWEVCMWFRRPKGSM